MAGHTMGPWSVGAFNSSSDEVEIVTGDLMTVTNVLGPGRVDEQTLADARLIAAAPDLLDGCKALLGLLQLLDGRPDMPPLMREAINSNHRIAEAKAAIAKAEAL
jgi:hypothetical protein